MSSGKSQKGIQMYGGCKNSLAFQNLVVISIESSTPTFFLHNLVEHLMLWGMVTLSCFSLRSCADWISLDKYGHDYEK